MDGTTVDERDDAPRRVAEAAMRIAAERGWRRVAPLEVARAAGMTLPAFYRRFPRRVDLLAAVSALADEAVLAEEPGGDGGDGPRDRLFDVMMRRFDALLPYRDGLAAVHRDLAREPATALAFAGTHMRSMAWMLRAAGIEAEDARGRLRAAGLSALYRRVFSVWLGDDTADLARTMAALDSGLRRAESWENTLCRSRRPGGEPASGGAASAQAPAG